MSADPWGSRRLWSLWDIMEKYSAQNPPQVFAMLMQIAQIASCSEANEDIGEVAKARLKLILVQAALVAAECGAKRSHELTTSKLQECEGKIGNAELTWFVDNLIRVFSRELGDQLFLRLPEGDVSYFEHEQPFGKAAYDAFPSARYDATEAATCFALDRWTASVHHSMSALEPALKALANDVGAAIKDGMWKGVIDRIESKIDDLKKTLPRGAARNERLNFLSAAAKEFFYFKEGWRNWVAHAKVQYDREQALGAMNHVGAFMRHLATRLSEPSP